MQKILSTFILLFLFSCKHTGRQNHSPNAKDTFAQSVTKTDALPQAKRLSEKERELERKELKEQEMTDSLRLSNVLRTAMTYAHRNKNIKSYQHEFETTPDDSSISVTTQMIFGNLFESNKKHLLVRRTVPWGVICNVFLLDKGNFKNVCEREQFGMTYLDDSLKDVNGDGYKDFLIHWYPPSGCCRRDVYNVFLYVPRTGSFSNDYEFINPTFSPNEKVIRGIEYGHPGEIGLYKYKWNGLQVDTIEFIYPHRDHKGKFIKTKKQEDGRDGKDGVVLNNLPKEYRAIKSVEWFLEY